MGTDLSDCVHPAKNNKNTKRNSAAMSTLDVSAMTSFDTSAICLGDVQVSTKGAKSAPLSFIGGKSIFLHASDLTPLFEPSAFNDASATRVNLCLSTNDTVESTLNQIDAHVIALLVPASQKMFGSLLSEAQVRERMQPSLRLSDKGFTSWRMKMNASGRNGVQIFDIDKRQTSPPDTWVGANLSVRVLVRNVWFMSKEWGIIYEAQAIQVEPRSVECPF
jgi:hypothetical protein